ncbi:MAG: hypothetical protein Q9172_006483, partial [Xanthocarpia lactea]
MSDITTLYTSPQHSTVPIFISINPRRHAVAEIVQAPSDGRSDSEHSHPEQDHHPQNPFVKLCYNRNMSSTPPTREGSAFDKKPVLSDQQRKANHTSSETKRRNRIKAWYWDLCQLVPDLKEKAPENCKRERVVLDRAREFARATMVKRNELIDALEAQGIDAERKFGLTRFEILPPIDPKAMSKSDDDTIEEDENDRVATEDANVQ